MVRNLYIPLPSCCVSPVLVSGAPPAPGLAGFRGGPVPLVAASRQRELCNSKSTLIRLKKHDGQIMLFLVPTGHGAVNKEWALYGMGSSQEVVPLWKTSTSILPTRLRILPLQLVR